MRDFDRGRLAHTRYPGVRRVMATDALRLGDGAIERVLERTFPDVAPEDVEDLMSSLQQFGRQAAPVAQRVLPVVAQRALEAGMVGGPMAAVAGGIVGGVGALASGAPAPPSRAPARATPSPTAPVHPARAAVIAAMAPPGGNGRAAAAPPYPTASAPAPAAPAAPAAPTAAASPLDGATPAAAAAAQLLALLSRPETMQALLAIVMAHAGRSTLPVGAGQVAPASFANAIAELAAVAASGDAPLAAGAADHLYDADEHPRGDLANPAERAAILLADLAWADALRAGDAYDAAQGDDALDDADEWEDDASFEASDGSAWGDPERPDA